MEEASAVLGMAHSAGTGVLVRLAGEDADASPFTAIAVNCPGYDTVRERVDGLDARGATRWC